MSDKRTIRSEAGVVVIEVRHSGASGVVAYTVSSKRTPECPSFDNERAEKAYFDAEVARCRGASI